MRFIRYTCIAIFGIALVTIALANREFVTLQALPPELSSVSATNPSVQVPLFAVIFTGILIGLLVGFVWEFMIEQGKVSGLKRKAAEVERLKAEVARLKAKTNDDKDDVLVLLDKAS